MDFWHKARSFADEATKRTRDLTAGASRLSDAIAQRADQLRSEAAKRAEELRSEAARRAEDVRRLATAVNGAPTETRTSEEDHKAFGVTEELTEFVQGITPTTFRGFPLEDDTQLYNVDTVSNVRQDLSEWQEKHAALVLSCVQEISKLRYELCPRFMKERKFWRIYFILVNNHVAPYEKMYRDSIKSKAAEPGKAEGEVKDDTVKEVKDEKVKDPQKGVSNSNTEVEETNQPNKTSTSSSIEQDLEVKDEKVKDPQKGVSNSNTEVEETNQPNKTSTSSSIEQDLDAFLLGDLAESDDAPDDDGGDFDDDFDKMLDGLDDDDDDDEKDD